MNSTDEKYVEVLLKPLRVCAKYRPAFGKQGGKPVTIEGFRIMYGVDPLYQWVGFDSDLMYAAHKAAGGMTSVYRQLGVGCERLFRAIAADQLQLTKEQLAWGYDVKGSDGAVSHLELDLKIDLAQVQDSLRRELISEWIINAARSFGLDESRCRQLRGAVFEVRQGYKSADAKRQNADLRSAIRSLNENYLFVVAVISSQINYTVLRRYRNSQVVVLVGTLGGNAIEDTFAFCNKVLGYSLPEFFTRNSKRIRTEVEGILKQLLSPQ